MPEKISKQASYLIPFFDLSLYSGAFYSLLFFLFAADTEIIAILKSGIFIIIFATAFSSAAALFKSKGPATAFSLVFSLIAVRLMPDALIASIAAAWGILGIVILVVAFILGLVYLFSRIKSGSNAIFALICSAIFFFLSWAFDKIRYMHTEISYELNEMLPLMGSFGKWACLFAGILYLAYAFSGKSFFKKT